MEPLILQTASEDAGKRLDAWLAEQTELTRSAVQKLMEEGRVTAAGKPLAKNTRLTGGETVSVELPDGCTLVNEVNVDITLENSKQSSKTQGESQNSSQTKTDENNQNGQSE